MAKWKNVREGTRVQVKRSGEIARVTFREHRDYVGELFIQVRFETPGDHFDWMHYNDVRLVSETL